ncbi:MAG: FAD binding domain-containing protein [Phycisphaerae bacterium]|nr:FAD binding domain-containing protein [Phycisphaerae bacterium]
MRVLTPTTVDEACEMLSRGGAAPTLIAGATDVLVHWPMNLAARDRAYVDLSGVDSLRGISWTDDSLTLGALATYWDVVRETRVGREFPLLVSAARQVGAVQIQSRGTWAGNIVNASPAADGVPVLMAYDAVVVMRSSSGVEEVRLDEFYVGYKKMRRRSDQLVTAVRVPRRAHDVQFFEKVGARRAQAISKVGLAVAHSGAGWRVVAASVAETVRRCRAVEGMLERGEAVRSVGDVVSALRQDISPIDDVRSTAVYRERVLARLIYHGLRGVCPGFS